MATASFAATPIAGRSETFSGPCFSAFRLRLCHAHPVELQQVVGGAYQRPFALHFFVAARQTIRQPLYRQFFGRCFNAVTRMVMGLPFADTQCGFKAFTRAAAQTVFQLQTIERWGFDPEILFIALKRGYRIVEVPVSWAHDERTRISYLKDGARMLQDVAIVRWNALAGRYHKQVERIHRAGLVK